MQHQKLRLLGYSILTLFNNTYDCLFVFYYVCFFLCQSQRCHQILEKNKQICEILLLLNAPVVLTPFEF